MSEASDTEEQQPVLREDKRRAEDASFASSLAALVAAPAATAQDAAPGAILTGRKRLKRTQEEEKHKAERVEQRRKRRELRQAKEKDHRAPQFDDKEKRLLRIATKGVVTLFNAVAKQQRQLQEKEDEEEETKHASKRQKVAPIIGRAELQGRAEKKEPQWAVLREDFMLQPSMKDWDKEQSDEDQGEQPTTAADLDGGDDDEEEQEEEREEELEQEVE